MLSEEDEWIVDFYRGVGTDHMGRSHAMILSMNDAWYEDTHDYIQWLFPLYVASRFNPQAPVLSDEVREVFLNAKHEHHDAVQSHFDASILRMFDFYGIGKGMAAAAGDVWMREGNHNQLRITRILRSMTLLGRHESAKMMHDDLLERTARNKIRLAEQTKKFWLEALRLPHV